MKLAPRFQAPVQYLWLTAYRSKLPRDMRRALTKYVIANIFEWETNQLRDERVLQQWNVLHLPPGVKQLKTQLVVEPWQQAFELLMPLRMTSMKLTRRHRSAAWPLQRYHWVWLHPE